MLLSLIQPLAHTLNRKIVAVTAARLFSTVIAVGFGVVSLGGYALRTQHTSSTSIAAPFEEKVLGLATAATGELQKQAEQVGIVPMQDTTAKETAESENNATPAPTGSITENDGNQAVVGSPTNGTTSTSPTPTPAPSVTPVPTPSPITPTPTPTPVPTPTPIPSPTPTPTPTPAVERQTATVTLSVQGSFTPGASAAGTLEALKNTNGYWDFTTSISVSHLQPSRTYQVWLCAANCSSHTSARFQTDSSGNGSISGVVIGHHQAGDPLNSIKIWELPPSGAEIPNDPTACFMVSNTSTPCLKSNLSW